MNWNGIKTFLFIFWFFFHIMWIFRVFRLIPSICKSESKASVSSIWDVLVWCMFLCPKTMYSRILAHFNLTVYTTTTDIKTNSCIHQCQSKPEDYNICINSCHNIHLCISLSATKFSASTLIKCLVKLEWTTLSLLTLVEYMHFTWYLHQIGSVKLFWWC